MMNEDYYCALSGLAPNISGEDEGDEFSDLPNGWLKITIQRRVENPDWQMIQEIKQASVAQMMSQIPSEQIEEGVERAVQLQIDAQYIGLEEKIGRYVVFEEVRYICDPEANEPVANEAVKWLDTIELDLEDFGYEVQVEEAAAIQAEQPPVEPEVIESQTKG
jgi:membrane-associated HD superfamily phosphohydrolase